MRVRLCFSGGCVFEGESAAYYGRLHQNMSLLRNGWFSTSRLFSVKAFDFEWHTADVQINKGCFLLWVLKHLLEKLDFKLESAEIWIPVDGELLVQMLPCIYVADEYGCNFQTGDPLASRWPALWRDLYKLCCRETTSNSTTCRTISCSVFWTQAPHIESNSLYNWWAISSTC